MQNRGTPLLLSASSTIANNSGGGVNALALKNPFQEPMEILEVRWQIRAGDQRALGGNIGCKLDMGNIEVTNGFIPVWLFGRADNYAVEETGITTDGVNHFAWKLPHPLFVPAGGLLMPSFEHRGLVTNSVTVRISYSCRSLPAGTPNPKRAPVPWVAAFISKTMAMTATDSDASQETDLVNKFDVPLYLQRFVGRAPIYRGDPTLLYNTEVGTGGPSQAPGQAVLTLKMVDSVGRPVVKDYARFRQVFGAHSRTWEAPGVVMDPRSYYNVAVAKVPYTASYQLWTAAHIALVGTRYIEGGAK